MRLVLLAILCTYLAHASAQAAELAVGQTPTPVKLEGELGGRISGEPWSSDELKGEVFTLFYIDPEEKAANEPLEAAFKKEKIPKDHHKSVAIINMAAAWYPNSMIADTLAKKQKEFPDTVYVKDFKKILVSSWGLKDDSVNVVVFGKDGKVIYLKRGPSTDTEFPTIMKTIRAAL